MTCILTSCHIFPPSMSHVHEYKGEIFPPSMSHVPQYKREIEIESLITWVHNDRNGNTKHVIK